LITRRSLPCVLLLLLSVCPLFRLLLPASACWPPPLPRPPPPPLFPYTTLFRSLVTPHSKSKYSILTSKKGHQFSTDPLIYLCILLKTYLVTPYCKRFM